MDKHKVIEFYGSQTAVAAALKISKQRVSAWGEIIPEGVAYKLQVITGGRLQVDPALYEKRKAR